MEPMPRRTYTVIFEPQPEGGYTATVPALPGCISEGNTLVEARRMVADAIRAWCTSCLMDGERLPRDIRRTPLHEKVAVTIDRR